MKGILEKSSLVLLFSFAVGLLVFNFLRVPAGLFDRESDAPEFAAVQEVAAAAAPQADRSAVVGDAAGSADGNAAAGALQQKLERPAAMPETGVIRVGDDTFLAAYDQLYERRAQYYGREIELAGYVMDQDDIAPGAFLIGRDLLWCCESDIHFIGFLAIAAGSPPAPGSTVLVRGILEPTEYRNPETGRTFAVPAIRCFYVAPFEGFARVVSPN